jgi:hypothetical protein
VAVYASQLDQAVIVASRDPDGQYQVGHTRALAGEVNSPP